MIRATRWWLLLVLLIALPGDLAAARNSAYGDYSKAVLLLQRWQYAEARQQIAAIEKKWPDALETRYLKAELTFLDGNYQATIDLLAGLDATALDNHVGELRSLATSTLEVTSDFLQRESANGNFVVFYPPGKDEAIVDLATEVLERAHRALGADLGFQPAERIRVEILARPSDLARVSALTETEIETSGTIALCKYNKLMVVTPRATLMGYPWMDTLAHELAHYVISQSSNDEVPIWFHEGLARFEQNRWRSATSGELNPIDEHLLATAVKKRSLIPFKQMHPSMAKLPSQEAVGLAFAEVYSMMTYLHRQVGYDGIRRMIAKQRQGKSAERAIAEVLEVRWSDVEKAWMKQLKSIKLKSSPWYRTPTIRFRKGGEESENVGVEEVASEVARKHARLGGLLRSRGMSEAAAIEYEKALAAGTNDDPFIIGKLSRTYLELQRYDRAIELAAPLAAADENDPTPATTLGLAYQAQGEQEKAVTAFELVLRINPFDFRVRCGLAEIYAARGEQLLAAREQRACELVGPAAPHGGLDR